MPLRRLMVFLCTALALAGCARSRYASAPQPRSELDMRMYGQPAPTSYAVRRVVQVVPVAASFEDGPYTLDSGDKLRIVVYPYVPNMTVENAIAIAGGFTPRASKDKVTITRKIQGVPTRTTLPLRSPIRPGDTVAVSERWF